jgi:hypothetical protein
MRENDGYYEADHGMPAPHQHQTRSHALNDGFDAVSQVAGSIFTKEAVATVTEAVGTQLKALKHQAEDGDNSLRTLALLGAILLIVVGGFEFASNIMVLHIPGALIELYSLLVGIMIIILEGKSILLPETLQASIFKYALFLKFLWGRGSLYFVVGTMQLYHMDLFNFIAGTYISCIGALMIFVGQRTAYKLKTMRRSLYSQQELQAKFAQSDVDGDGGLDLQQFRTLATYLGLDMTRRETEAAFSHISTAGEKLTYDDFYMWWIKTDMEHNIDERGFSSV